MHKDLQNRNIIYPRRLLRHIIAIELLSIQGDYIRDENCKMRYLTNETRVNSQIKISLHVCKFILKSNIMVFLNSIDIILKLMIFVLTMKSNDLNPIMFMYFSDIHKVYLLRYTLQVRYIYIALTISSNKRYLKKTIRRCALRFGIFAYYITDVNI